MTTKAIPTRNAMLSRIASRPLEASAFALALLMLWHAILTNAGAFPVLLMGLSALYAGAGAMGVDDHPGVKAFLAKHNKSLLAALFVLAAVLAWSAIALAWPLPQLLGIGLMLVVTTNLLFRTRR